MSPVSGEPGAVMAAALPAVPPLLQLRTTLAGNPHIALATLRAGRYSNPPYTGVSDEILNWLGRPGTSYGRRQGERHFLRIVPFLRDGWRHTQWRDPADAPTAGVTDLIVVSPEHLQSEGLLALIDAAAAASCCLWLLHGARMPLATQQVIEGHAEPLPWHVTEDALAALPDRNVAQACAGLQQHWRIAGEVQSGGQIGDMSAADAALRTRATWDDCPKHAHWSGCLRTAAAHINAAMLMHDAELRAVVMALLRDSPEPRWVFHELARDSFAPARDAAEDLLRSAGADAAEALDLKVRSLAPDGSSLQTSADTLVVPHQMRPVLLRQRALTLLSGGTHDSALLTIWGQDARIWGTRPRPTPQRRP